MEQCCDKLLLFEINQFNKQIGNLVGYDCKECLNKGEIAYPVYDEDFNIWNFTAKRCKCQKIRKNQRLIAKSGVAENLQTMTFDNYQANEKWQHRIKVTAKNFKDGWFYIGGQVGCGKTHICTAIVGEFLKQNKECLYVIWPSIAKELKTLINTSAYDEKIKHLEDIEVLYIDDFFKAQNGQTSKVLAGDINIAFDIINSRYNKRKTTIISSEFTTGELIEIDQAIASRIVQRCGTNKLDIVQDGSRNWRLK